MFDVPPPVVVKGLDAYAGDDVAFATAVLRCGSKEELKKDDTPRLQLTVGLRKENGQWEISHKHHSFPLENTE